MVKDTTQKVTWLRQVTNALERKVGTFAIGA